jgi:2-dehydro-3-deoxyphosphogluconate aldolase/(4S)-4-hydroxy-2-oxoglutarate aldolase
VNSVFEELADARLIAVLTIEDAGLAATLASALSQAGVRFAEVTLRTPEATAALQAFAEQSGLCVGAGTVLTAGQVDRALDAGARFVVSPGLSSDVVARCQRAGVAVLPGVATATDVMRALDAGLEVAKFFPAEPLGGTRCLQALSGPFPAMRWVPTGGIGRDDVARYLRMPSVLAVGGSWMAPAGLIAAGCFDEILQRAASAAELAARPRWIADSGDARATA